MKLFTYRGVRVKKYHEKIRRTTFFIFLLPFLIGFGFFIYTHQVQLQQSPLPYGIGLGVSLLIVILLLLLLQAICYQKLLFFSRLDSLRIISHFLIENNLVLVKKIKTEKGFIERTSLPKVYLKRDRFSVTVTFQLQGSRFQER